MKEIKFKEWNCNIELGTYTNGRTSIALNEIGTGEPVIVATVNIPTYADLKPNEVLIKNYSENHGIMNALIIEGVISKPIHKFKHGFITVNVCELLIKKEDL